MDEKLTQFASDADTLHQLWKRSFAGSPPSLENFCHWLTKGLTFYEIGKLIHKVQKLNNKYNNSLTPSQLRTYFRQLATLEVKDKTNGRS